MTGVRSALPALALMCASAYAQTPPPDDAAAFERGLEAYLADDFPSAWFFWLGPAERGFVEAQFSLGVLYLNGEGVPADPARARSLFERAAEGGHARARLNFALMLANGQGGPRDLVAAYVLAYRTMGQMAGDERREARAAAELIGRYMRPDEVERARRALMEGPGPRR
jgi:TPR repeat protein